MAAVTPKERYSQPAYQFACGGGYAATGLHDAAPENQRLFLEWGPTEQLPALHAQGAKPLLGLVLALVVTPEGFPLSYEVFEGSRADVTTLEEALEAVERKYGRGRRMWVFECFATAGSKIPQSFFCIWDDSKSVTIKLGLTSKSASKTYA